MTTPDNQPKAAPKPAVFDPARDRSAQKYLAILEQMYGYFSYEPMPLESARRQAA